MTFTAETYDEYRAGAEGWGIVRDGDERFFLMGLTRKQAEYGAMIADADAFPFDSDADNADWLREQIAHVVCERCGMARFAAQLDTSGRGPECQS